MLPRSLMTAGRLAVLTFVFTVGLRAEDVPAFRGWAPTPPMGWNSWDCFGTAITEAQTRAQANFMAAKLAPHGWNYLVVDIEWYAPAAEGHEYKANAELAMDGYGRLLPAVNRFPSATGGAGFKPLAEYVHGLGLKFGVHLMRGVPRQAVARNAPVLGTSLHARDIVDEHSTCPWNPDMYGVDMTKPGAQAYYDSVFALLAEWGVDYVKVDDASRPYEQHRREIEAIRHAIDRTGRPMVLSLSPGATPLTVAEHVRQHANLWRISDDFWDRWLALRQQFARLAAWNEFRREGAWPDADMLPLGVLVHGERSTRFTADEQRTMLTLWAIARAPLIHGGDMTKTDALTLSLLTNDEVIAVDQHSMGNRPVFARDGLVAWVAEVPDSPDEYLAVFNTRDRAPLTPGRAGWSSGLIGRGGAAEATIDLAVVGATRLVLAAEPADANDANAHALWMEPRIVMKDGSEQRLTEMKWDRTDALWDQVSTEKAPSGRPMTHAGKRVAYGVAANGESRVEYTLPDGAVRFRATVAVDDAVLMAGEGAAIRFYVFAVRPADEWPTDAAPVQVGLKELGLKGTVQVRDLWAGRDLGRFDTLFGPSIPFHGAGLYRLSPK